MVVPDLATLQEAFEQSLRIHTDAMQVHSLLHVMCHETEIAEVELQVRHACSCLSKPTKTESRASQT